MKTKFFLVVCILFAGALFAQEDKYTFEETNPVYWETDVASLIEINDQNDISQKRRKLIDYIWGDEGFPAEKLPAKIENNISDDRYDELRSSNLARIDRLVIDMDWGMQSIAYLFVPEVNKKQLVIYQQGHRGDFVQGIETIKALVKEGYAVMAFSMPLLGMNPKPVVQLPRFGRFKLEKHDHLKLLPRPIKYFMEPMAVGLNYALNNGYSKAHMIGISGGGWTTTLFAAIDPRIEKSFPVAGTYPIFLRSEENRDWGDYEQTDPDLYRIANYPELYIMGASGKGRLQFQLLNKYDSCCFAGTKFEVYEKIITDRVNRLGPGSFKIFSDDSHKEHMISPVVIKLVIEELKK